MNDQLTKLSYTELSFDDWEAKFKPMNNYMDSNASFQDDNGLGIMFETYDIELEYVKSRDPLTVWTYMDSEYTGTVIVSGYHVANRIGYFVTSVPRKPDESFIITVSEDTND
jgi:hypothetical protein